jgi:hypothetical protein
LTEECVNVPSNVMKKAGKRPGKTRKYPEKARKEPGKSRK